MDQPPVAQVLQQLLTPEQLHHRLEQLQRLRNSKVDTSFITVPPMKENKYIRWDEYPASSIAGFEHMLDIKQHQLLSDPSVSPASISFMQQQFQLGGRRATEFKDRTPARHHRGQLAHMFGHVHVLTGRPTYQGFRERMILYHLGKAQFIAVFYAPYEQPEAWEQYREVLDQLELRWFAHKDGVDASQAGVTDEELSGAELAASLL